VQEGRHVARQIERRVRGLDAAAFRYRDPGIMATIGRSAAVVELPRGIRLTGYFAWVTWLALHIWKLIGFRNRFSVMVDWVHNYFTYDRSSRLIFEARQPPDGE
jgi:NADH dehydrogenase